jgi:hypothetical protein
MSGASVETNHAVIFMKSMKVLHKLNQFEADQQQNLYEYAVLAVFMVPFDHLAALCPTCSRLEHTKDLINSLGPFISANPSM